MNNIRPQVSSIDLSGGSFVDKHTGVYKLVHLSHAESFISYTFTSGARFQAVCREPGFPAEHLTT